MSEGERNIVYFGWDDEDEWDDELDGEGEWDDEDEWDGEDECCPNCGSANVSWRPGDTYSSSLPLWYGVCNNCGHKWSAS